MQQTLVTLEEENERLREMHEQKVGELRASSDAKEREAHEVVQSLLALKRKREDI